MKGKVPYVFIFGAAVFLMGVFIMTIPSGIAGQASVIAGSVVNSSGAATTGLDYFTLGGIVAVAGAILMFVGIFI